MPVKDVFKISRKTFFNPSGWIGWDMLIAQFKESWAMVKSLFVAAKPQREETFEQAMQRFKLTEDNIKSIEKRYMYYAIGFLVLGGLALIYAFYLLLIREVITGWMLAMCMAALFLAQAFRFHFWSFQIKYRKLGCTFEEWKRGKPFPDGGA